MRARRWLALALIASAATAAAPSSRALADPQSPWALRTIAGGPGVGPATSLGVSPLAVGFRGGHLLALGDGVVRDVDLTSGTASVAAGTGLPEAMTDQTHALPTLGGPIRGIPGPGPMAGLTVPGYQFPDRMFVGPDGTSMLSYPYGSNGEPLFLTSDDRIRSASCYADEYAQAIPDLAGGCYYTRESGGLYHRDAFGVDHFLGAGQTTNNDACPVGPATTTPVDLLNLAQMTLDPAKRLVLGLPECVVRYDASTGSFVRIAGSDSGTGSTGDGGPAVDAHLDRVEGITYATTGELFIATGPEVREVRADGTITTVAGSGQSPVPPNSPVLYYGVSYGPPPRTPAEMGDGGPAGAATMWASGVAVDGDRLAIIDQADQRVRVVSPISATGTITTVLGNGWPGSGWLQDQGAPGGHGSDGPAVDSQLAPTGEAIAPDGTRYVTTDWDTVVAIGADGVAHTVAGTGVRGFSADGTTATAAMLKQPSGVTVSPDGTVYFTDNYNRIRRIASDGTLSTVAGGGSDTGDGVPAASAAAGSGWRMAVDALGRVFWSGGTTIRMFDPGTGLVTTVAGGGNATSDGPAKAVQLTGVGGVTLAPDGRLVFADGDRLRALTGAGTPGATVTTLAGEGGTTSCMAPPGGSGGVGLQTPLSSATDVVVASSGDMFLVDSGALERLDVQGRLTLVAGVRCSNSPGAPFAAVGNDRASIVATGTGLDSDDAPLIVDRAVGRIYRATPDHPLAAPTITSVTPGSRQIDVSWSPPDVPADSSGVRTYTVTAEPGGHQVVVYATTTRARFRGLDNGVNYQLTVRAENTAGEGAESQAVHATPGANPPGRPRSLWIDPVAGGLVVHFQPPLDDGGGAVTSYVAVASPGGRSATGGANAESIRIGGLSHRSYTIAVHAVNAAGSGPTAKAAATPDVAPHATLRVRTSPRTHVVISSGLWMRDVDAADVQLTDGSGHNVAVRLSCANRNGSAVDCAQQVVWTITVTPRKKLAAGHAYRLVFDPSGDHYPVTDLNGNRLPGRLSFRAGSAG